ncbi:MAG: ABC transporter permease [Firmicutes bacterium]|nr:ABC transporter permease [Bacillota bacterium]
MNNKKIIFRVTREYMKKNRRRTRITFLGILVMVILMTAVFAGKNTMMAYMADIISADRGSWHAMVYGVNADQVDEIRSLDYVDQAYVSRALGYTDFAQSGKPEVTPFLELKGYSPAIFELLNIQLVEGRYPENENEIIISQLAVSDGAKIHVGDTIEIDTFDRLLHAFSHGEDDGGFLMFSSSFMVPHGETVTVPDHFPFYYDNTDFEMIHEPTGYKKTCTVVGIMESPYYEIPGMGGYMAFTATESIVAAGESVNLVLTADPDKPNDLSADLNRIVNETLTAEEMEDLLEHGTSAVSESGERIPVQNGRIEINELLLLFIGRGTDGSFSLLIAFLQAFFVILITIASLILIYNVFSISFKERSRYLGMLSSIGATRQQKRWSVYYEAFVLLAGALPLGIGLGLLVVRGGMALLSPYVTKIMEMVGTNIVTGRSVHLSPRLVIQPMAFVLIILFSVLAVFLSAALPARAISKTGPLENIRGNDEYPKKRCRTFFGLMNKGQSEALLAAASIRRGRYSSRGIVRSIATLLVLVLVTAFSANLVCDLIRTKLNSGSVQTGSDYDKYEYLFEISDDVLYEEGMLDIVSSDEIRDWKQFDYYFNGIQIRMEDLSEEYRTTFEQFLLKYFPDGIPAAADEAFLHPSMLTMNPNVNRLVVTSEDFRKIAEKAGLETASVTEEHPGVIVYRPYAFDSDDFRIEFAGAIDPDYIRYELSEPLAAQPGDILPLFLWNYDKDEVVDLPMTFCGYADAADFSDIVKLSIGDVWLIISEEANDWILEKAAGEYTGMEFKGIFLSPTKDDANVIRRLSLMEDAFGNTALHSAKLVTDAIDFRAALFMIIRILALCFTVLITIMCLLNLYNSVMGRRLARHRELSVLESMGMTKNQLRKMLLLENGRLLSRSFIPGVLISAGFMVLLHQVVSGRFGHLVFRMPVWIILLTAAVCVGSLLVFTAMCYHQRTKDALIEEIRKESI